MAELTSAQKMAVFGGAGLLVDSFLPWYGISSSFIGSININAWDVGFLGWGGVLLVVAGAAIVYLKASGTRDVEAGGMAPEQLAFILAAAGTALIVLRFLTQTSLTRYGLFLGIILAGVSAYGAFQNTKDAGLEVPGSDIVDNIRGGDDDASGD